MKGIVIRFDRSKCYGFIDGEDGQSYFVHQSNILMSGYRYLVEDQKVKFKPSQNVKGLEAIEVEIVEE